MNILQQGYESFDDFMCLSANVITYGYNWVTGNTKSDLANTVMFFAPVLESISFSNTLTLDLAIPASIGMYYASYRFQREAKEFEEEEIAALESRCLDPEVEDYKNKLEQNGAIYLTSSVTMVAMLDPQRGRIFGDTDVTNKLFALGVGLRSAAHYIMRSNNFPPRKNCIRRGLDRIMQGT